MRLRSLVPTILLLCAIPALAFASNPIPGVGIVIKQCKCPPSWKCCGAATVRVAGGFFGPGSAPVDSGVTLMGRCSHECNGCDADCGGGPPDGRIDYAADAPSGPFGMTLPALALYSIDPFPVRIGGVTVLLDVLVELSGPAPGPADAFSGILVTAEGQELGLGATSTVAASSLDLHATMSFTDHVTGVPVGGTIEQDLHLALQDAALPVARLADGTATGHIVLGDNGAVVTPFTYASDDLQVRMLSAEPGTPVPARARSWGALKTTYR